MSTENSPAQKHTPDGHATAETAYRFSPEEYGEHLIGHAAAKLADSAVAPIVAVARGYWRAHTEEGVKEWCTRYGITGRDGKYQALMRTAVGTMDDGSDRDMLVMPWHSFKALTLKETANGADGHPPEFQIRPCEPIVVSRKHPKPQKYSWGKGTPQLLDAHPATPRSFADDAPVVLFAEGLLKGDAALSAFLAAQGAGRELLGHTGADAAEKLEEFMATIPVDEQVLILRASSSTTLHKDKGAWQELNLANRVAWIGFDADVGTNKLVWNSARALWNQLEHKQNARTVKLLSPVSEDGSKDGLDDYLSHTGDWWSLTDQANPHLRETMPDFPEEDPSDLPVDTWRITKDGTGTERLAHVTDDQGNPRGKDWLVNDLKLGGRIIYRQERREPTRREMLDGDVSFGNADPSEMEVGIEVSWRDGEEIVTEEIVGPITMLNYTPAEWHKNDAVIPANLILHPQWPPRNRDGEKWVEAIKRSSEDYQELVEWTKMGWLPVEGHMPAFAIGDSIIAESDDAAAETRCGVSSNELSGFSSFGIGGRGDDTNLHWADDWHAWIAQARKDFNDLLDLYVTSGAWTDPAVSALVICTMFRPIVPVFEPVSNPRSTLFIYGPPGGGKSMTAKHIMAAWAADGSDWSSNLPGSAESTKAAMEKATSMSPIWVIDDLAPSVSRREAETQEQAVANVVRNTFNAQAKQRMKRDMSTQKELTPRSQLMVTAENMISSDSAAQRMIPVFISRGSLNPDPAVTEAIFERNARDGLAARCSAHLVLSVLWRAKREGWENLTRRYARIYRQEQERVRELLVERGANRSKITRMAELIADMTIVMTLFKDADGSFGMGRDWHRRTLDDTAPKYGLDARWDDADQFRNHIADMMISVHTEQQDRTPGRSMLSAIRMLLSTKNAHIASAESPASPPYVTDQLDAEDDPSRTDSQVNTKLGWNYIEEGRITKSGAEIGVLVQPQRRRSVNGPTVLIDPTAAFNIAQKVFPNLIMPGAKADSMFSSMWDEDICPPKLADLRGYKASKHSVRLSVPGDRPKGVPIPLETVLYGLDDDEDDESAEEEERDD